MRKVNSVSAALKLEMNTSASIFSDQYSMFDLTWIASDEIITMKNNPEIDSGGAADLPSDFEQIKGHVYVCTECMYARIHGRYVYGRYTFILYECIQGCKCMYVNTERLYILHTYTTSI